MANAGKLGEGILELIWLKAMSNDEEV